MINGFFNEYLIVWTHHLMDENIRKCQKLCDHKSNSSRYCRQGNYKTNARSYDDSNTRYIVLKQIFGKLSLHGNVNPNPK